MSQRHTSPHSHQPRSVQLYPHPSPSPSAQPRCESEAVRAWLGPVDGAAGASTLRSSSYSPVSGSSPLPSLHAPAVLPSLPGLDAPSVALTFAERLSEQRAYYEPRAAQRMREAMGVPPLQSCLPIRSDAAVARTGEYARIRDEQSCGWADESVARGIAHAKVAVAPSPFPSPSFLSGRKGRAWHHSWRGG